MATTAMDVASRAGVSVSTVSRAFTSPELLAHTTLSRVQRAARDLGYLPGKPGATGQRVTTHNIGLVVPDLVNPHFAALAKQFQGRMRELGFRTFLADTDEDPALEVDVVTSLAPQVDAVVLFSSRATDDEIHRYAERTVVVLVNRCLAPHGCVRSDEVGGAREIVRHLAALGHRTIAFAGGPTVSWTGRQRLHGLQLAAGELGLEPIVPLGSFQPKMPGGVAAADLFLATPATALVTHNDLMGFGALARLSDRGVRVPDQASVASFDDIPFATLARPALTSLGASPTEVARAACAVVNQALTPVPTATPEKHQRTIPMNLHVRGSTGPARPRHIAPGSTPGR